MIRALVGLIFGLVAIAAPQPGFAGQEWHGQFRDLACRGDFPTALSMLRGHVGEFSSVSREAFNLFWLEQTVGQEAPGSRHMDVADAAEPVVTLCTGLSLGVTLSVLWEDAAGGRFPPMLIDMADRPLRGIANAQPPHAVPAASVVPAVAAVPVPAEPRAAVPSPATVLGPPASPVPAPRRMTAPPAAAGAAPTIQLGYFRQRASAAVVQDRVLAAGVGLTPSQIVIIEVDSGMAFRLVAHVRMPRETCKSLKSAGIDCLPLKPEP